MGYKSENLEKLRSLSEKITMEDRCKNCEVTQSIADDLKKIYNLLEKPRLDKKIIKNEIMALLTKLS